MSQNNINPLNFSLGNIDEPNLVHDEENSLANNIMLRNEIKNIEASLNLLSLPQFYDILTHFQQGNHLNLYRLCMSNLVKIIQIREKDNEIKVDYVNQLTKLEHEKQNLESALNKVKNNLNEITEKLRRSEQVLVDKKKNWKEKKQKLFSEIEQEQKLNQKVRTREAQLFNEIKKKENLITKQNEQIKKLISMDKGGSSSASKDFNFLSAAPRKDLEMSYPLVKNSNFFNSGNNNINLNNANQNSARSNFLEDLQKNLDAKYSSILKENEMIKSFLFELHFKLANLVNIKKEVFLDNYKKTFGTEFGNENNIDLNADTIPFLNEKVHLNSNFSLSLEIEPFVSAFNSNFVKLKEYLMKNDELSYINNFMDGQRNQSHFKKDDINSYLTDKYVQNLSEILENYKHINSHQTDLLHQTLQLKQSRQENVFNGLVSKLEDIDLNLINNNKIAQNSLHLKYVRDGINENNSILQKYSRENLEKINHYSQDIINAKELEKINIENLVRFNNGLKEEIEGYESIITNAMEFCQR